MTLFKLNGEHESGEEWGGWDGFYPYYPTMEEAERRKAIEIAAYTYQGVCDWTFWITSVEVKE